jgi:uncharacterized protein YggL (DUF469 family)
MKKDARSTSRLRRLNSRQRKKLRVGEFKENSFDVEFVFRAPVRDVAHSAFIDEFFGFLEARGLMGGGFASSEPFTDVEGVIVRIGRGSPTEEDREAVVGWLRAHRDVVDARVNEFRDAWHDHD